MNKETWPLFGELELTTMGWGFIFHKKTWDEINALLRNGDYDEAEQKALKFREDFPSSIMPDILLLEAQHRKGDFKACQETYNKSNRPELAFFNAENKTPLVLELCEAMLDLQSNIPVLVQAAWQGGQECIEKVMRGKAPERAFVICAKAVKAAIDMGRPLFGGDEKSLLEEYIESGLARYPQSAVLLEMKSEL